MTAFFDFVLSLWEPLRELIQFVIQIGLLTVVIYTALLFLKGTRAEPIMIGIVTTILSGWLLSQMFGLEVIEWILAKLPALMVFAILIIFQPELRRAFAEIGINPHRLRRSDPTGARTINALVEASYQLAAKHIGGLIAIEQDIGMRSYTEAGVKINAPLSSELLVTIFYPNTPLHDGGVVIKNGIILSAACFFPLTQTNLSRTLGTRHRAAIGITEETDAVVIIVSEEDGSVSLAHKGRLVRDIEKERLERHLTNYLVKKKSPALGAPGTANLTEHLNTVKMSILKNRRSKEESES